MWSAWSRELAYYCYGLPLIFYMLKERIIDYVKEWGARKNLLKEKTHSIA